MTPKEYYYTHFQTDFARFFSSLNRKGSLSRRRGSLLRIGVDTLAPQSDEYFSVYDFCIERRIDHLRDISSKNYFMFSVAYTILIDQLMYTHFKESYPKFREITLYPKMDGSAGWAGSISHANPFAIFNDDFIRTRDIDFVVLQEEFTEYAKFILEDLEDFFDKYGEQIGNINWAQVKTVMQKDRDIGCTPIGIIFYNKLFKSVST
jgi:hypothetical protein